MEAHKIPFKLIFTYVLKVLGLVVGVPVLLSPMVSDQGVSSTVLMVASGGLISFLFIYFAYMLITGIYRFNCDVTEIKALVSVLFSLVLFLVGHMLLVFFFVGSGFQPQVLSFILPQALVGLTAIWAFKLPENI